MKLEILSLGFLLIIIGIALVFIGVVSETLKAREAGKGEVRGGGVILIGPIPIVFGTDTGAVKVVLGLTIAVMILAILLFSGRIRI